jgi:2-oxoglutarate dehydrogenase E1 component
MNGSFINPLNLRYLEELYETYRKNPRSVHPDWEAEFAALQQQRDESGNGGGQASGDGSPVIETTAERRIAPAVQEQLNRLIDAYRDLGHRAASVDPLALQLRGDSRLDPAAYGFTAGRMEQLFPCAGLHWPGPLPLREIIDRLRQTYCGSIGCEFGHLEDAAARDWLQERMETRCNRFASSIEQQRRMLAQLIQASVFEEYTRNQFVGATSFSLEGCESLIPLLDFAAETAARDGLDEIVLAMAHRGRLNVLVNLFGKKHREVFREFIDRPSVDTDGGDVKYHLGHSADYRSATGRTIHLSLCFNPSHLEFVSPVALGRVRAKQDRSGDLRRERGMALLIHGDASFPGEGIVQETLNLGGLPAYSVGGTLHVIINNQIGFTTCPAETRSTAYASDVAKMLQVPVFHVNADDPEAVLQAVWLAMRFRRRFAQDAVVDLIGYRRHGHNEGDEPSFTQPLLYQRIRAHPPVHELYVRRLIDRQVVTRADAESVALDYRNKLDRELALAQTEPGGEGVAGLSAIWSSFHGGPASRPEKVTTAVDKHRLVQLLEAQARLPDGFHPHPKIIRAAALRREMAAERRPVDWAGGEALAFASLASEGVRVRLAGQDTARGTFSQRHAVLHDVENGRQHAPLQHVAPTQAPVEIYNSPLSEAGALGFEYGYSLDYPSALVLWEAQYGDFVNAAQVIIDQFIASAEEKWRRLSGLVLLLPHGFEGMGPEHSSARLERFLQLGARDNLQIISPTTPAQYFHSLRRQALRRWRKPLVIMTPKSLLRHREAVSPLVAFSRGDFEEVIGEPRRDKPAQRILLCSGKIYYELKNYRAERQRDDVALIRVEQLYPVPLEALAAALSDYPGAPEAVWVQEEPLNMGAACFWSLRFGTRLFERLPFSVVARPASASPATASPARHRQEQAALLAAAFGEAG